MSISRRNGPIIRNSFPLDGFSTAAKRRMADWLAAYTEAEQQLGNTASLVNFGDEVNAGLVSAATFTGMKFNASGLAPIWTPSTALSIWTTPFDLSVPNNWVGRAPKLTFNGTSDRMTTPDATYWTRALAAFSVGAWVYLTDATSSAVMAKYTTTGNLREWQFWFNSADKLQLVLWDEDDAATPNATLDTEANAAISEGVWHHVVATYDGSANASGIDIYIDGAVVASTDTDDVNFVSMRNYTAVVELGTGNGGNFFDGSTLGGPYGPFFVQAQLTAAQVYNRYARQRLAIGV